MATKSKQTNISISDNVELSPYGDGIVRCIIQDKDTIRYGVRLNSKCGNNNGVWKGVTYFHCPAGHGVFVTRSSIVTNGKIEYKTIEIEFGSTVYVKPPYNCMGTVNYIGPKHNKLKMQQQTYNKRSIGTAISGHMYYGVKLLNHPKHEQIYVREVMLLNEKPQTNKELVKKEIKKETFKVDKIHNCFRINAFINADNVINVENIFIIPDEGYCIIVATVKGVYQMQMYKLKGTLFEMIPDPTTKLSVFMESILCMFDAYNCRLITISRTLPANAYIYDIDIQPNNNKVQLNEINITDKCPFNDKCIFMSMMNNGNEILFVLANGCMIRMDAKKYEVLQTINVSNFYHNSSESDKRNFKILTVTMHERKNCIAWIECEYNSYYYLQIYSLDLIKKCKEPNKAWSQYLTISRLLCSKNESGNSKLRRVFCELIKERAENADGYDIAWLHHLRPRKVGKTKYVLESSVGISEKSVKLEFNDNADKLLYCSMDSHSNDLLVIDRNTMTTSIVTSKGTPFWMFEDYLMVSKIGKQRNNGFCTMDIQGFISETSIAELLYANISCNDDDDEDDVVPWSVCLQIAVYVGTESREYRDITLMNYKKEVDCEIRMDDIEPERRQIDNVWSIGQWIVMLIGDEIVFYDSQSVSFKNEDTFTAFSDGKGIVARNNKKNQRTFQKVWAKHWKK